MGTSPKVGRESAAVRELGKQRCGEALVGVLQGIFPRESSSNLGRCWKDQTEYGAESERPIF